MASEQSDDDIFIESPPSKPHRFSSSTSPRLTMKYNQESSCKNI